MAEQGVAARTNGTIFGELGAGSGACLDGGRKTWM